MLNSLMLNRPSCRHQGITSRTSIIQKAGRAIVDLLIGLLLAMIHKEESFL